MDIIIKNLYISSQAKMVLSLLQGKMEVKQSRLLFLNSSTRWHQKNQEKQEKRSKESHFHDSFCVRKALDLEGFFLLGNSVKCENRSLPRT